MSILAVLWRGRRWSDGLHRNRSERRREIKSENQTVCVDFLQNYFRLYDKLAGMTGTADTRSL